MMYLSHDMLLKFIWHLSDALDDLERTILSSFKLVTPFQSHRMLTIWFKLHKIPITQCKQQLCSMFISIHVHPCLCFDQICFQKLQIPCDNELSKLPPIHKQRSPLYIELQWEVLAHTVLEMVSIQQMFCTKYCTSIQPKVEL